MRTTGLSPWWLATFVILGCVPEQADPGRTAAHVDADSLARTAAGEHAPAATKEALSAPLGQQIRVSTNEGAPFFEVVGLDEADLRSLADSAFTPAQWAELFVVYAAFDDHAQSKDRPPVLGSYRIGGQAIQFRPRFPIERGLRYRAVFDPKRLLNRAQNQQTGVGEGSEATAAGPIVAVLSLPKKPSAPSTTVTHVYPSTNRLPENQLKFYLHFSAPMSRGDVYNYIHLLDASGKAVELPFLELGEELWDPAGTRLTLLFDPGRIKQGLKPREEAGPVLESGKTYTLVIDRAMPDAEGKPLRESFRKEFGAGRADTESPDPRSWRIAPPEAGASSPLVVSFPEPLDHAMLQRVLQVNDAAGHPVPGHVVVDANEMRWSFTPEHAWSAGEYAIVVDTNLEDLAGNNIGRTFEVDEFHTVQGRIQTETSSIPFHVQAAASRN